MAGLLGNQSETSPTLGGVIRGTKGMDGCVHVCEKERVQTASGWEQLGEGTILESCPREKVGRASGRDPACVRGLQSGSWETYSVRVAAHEAGGSAPGAGSGGLKL